MPAFACTNLGYPWYTKIIPRHTRNTSNANGCSPFKNFILDPPVPLTLLSIASRFHSNTSALCHVGYASESGTIRQVVKCPLRGYMKSSVRTLAIVNGGGDAPGLNPVIRAIARSSIYEHNMRVIGIRNGFDGLIWPEGAKDMTDETISGILPRGGTILGTTNRGNPFAYKVVENGQEAVHDYSDLCMDNARRLGIEAMIVIGGDGTQHIARDFSRRGVNIVGVPKTIDNDLDATEVTFGFDTALVIATEAIDRLHTTAQSHQRVMLIEVMGRDAGWIALHAGIAGGAHIILVPEIPFSFEAVCDAVRARELRGKHFSLIVVAEGVKLPAADPQGKPIPPVGPGGVTNVIADILREMLQKEIRVTVLVTSSAAALPLLSTASSAHASASLLPTSSPRVNSAAWSASKPVKWLLCLSTRPWKK